MAPSERRRRIIWLIILLALLRFLKVSHINKFNGIFSSYSPSKLVIFGYLVHFIFSNFLSIFGLVPKNLNESHYHPSFAKLRRVLTGLDAGIVSSLHIKPKVVRNYVSYLLGGYFLLFPKRAEDKMHRFHKNPTINGIRACWTKGRHPITWTIQQLKDKRKINFHRKLIKIPRNDNSNTYVKTYLYFQGSELELKNSKHIVINYPGGGFIAMNPKHHESYIRKWANYLRIPILSVDYRKAPEYPYPNGFNDCFAVYYNIIKTNGKIIGIQNINNNKDLKIALTGDSAGGNLAAVVCLRCIKEKIKIPNGILMAYPALDLDPELFTRYDLIEDNIDTNILNNIDMNKDLSNIYNNKEKYFNESIIHKENLDNDNNNTNNNSKNKKTKETLHKQLYENYKFTSRARYSDDGVLPFQYTLAIANAYIPPNCDPRNDIYLSPIRASKELLSQWPPCRIHVGSCDPMSDDSRRFIIKLKHSNPNNDVKLLEWEGVSHAYIQSPTWILPQARYSCELSVQWLADMLQCKIYDKESFKYPLLKNQQKKAISKSKL